MIVAGRDPSPVASEPVVARGAVFHVVYWLVLGGGALALAASPFRPGPPWILALGLGALLVLSELVPVWLPRGGYSSPGSVVDFASLLLVGAGPTAWLVAGSTLFAQLVCLRRPRERAVFNAALFAIMIWGAGRAAAALGAAPGALDLPGDLPAIAAAALAYFAINSAGMSLVLGLTQGLSPARVLQRNYLGAAPVHLAHLAIGASFAVIAVHVGAWGIAVALVPLVAAGLGLRRDLEMRRDLLEFVRALAGVLEEVDPYTRRHSLRVAEYSKRLARAMGVAERHIEDIEYGALLHDLGKVGRSYQGILNKPARLSWEEERLVRLHPDRGADIVGRVRWLGRAAEYVRCHHERVDGAGYPRGLTGRALPRGARIIMVCDAFDAMTSDRAYRRAMGVDTALAELAAGAGSQFDAGAVETLVRLVRERRWPLLYRRTVDARGHEPPAAAIHAASALRGPERSSEREADDSSVTAHV